MKTEGSDKVLSNSRGLWKTVRMRFCLQKYCKPFVAEQISPMKNCLYALSILSSRRVPGKPVNKLQQWKERGDTNEQTSYWTISKKRCFLKNCDNSDFSGCFVIISLLCSLNWKHMRDAFSKIWRHNITTKHWLEALPASLQRLLISFTRYWNFTATTSIRYFCRLIKYPPNFETDLVWIQILFYTY